MRCNSCNSLKLFPISKPYIRNFDVNMLDGHILIMFAQNFMCLECKRNQEEVKLKDFNAYEGAKDID